MATLLSDRLKVVQERYNLLPRSPLADQRRNVSDHPRWNDLIRKGSDKFKDDVDEAAKEGANLMGPAFIPAESTVRNDYSQHFVDTAGSDLPGNAVRNPEKPTRFQEYPKLKRLMEIKADILSAISHPPLYLQADLLNSLSAPTGDSFHLAHLLPIKFDVAIIDPPLETYEWESVPSSGAESNRVWSWDQVAALPVPQIMAKESFIFLWVGSGASDGLERGREVLMRWGYRRCEDIVWVQTNNVDHDTNTSTFIPGTPSSCFAKSSQHCLMGIRGTVRRSTDTNFVHCNIDTDVIVWPGEKRQDSSATIDTRRKPPEMMDLAENFCLGTRRLELFGGNRNLRRGWLTVGLEVGPEAPAWERAETGTNACAAKVYYPSSPLVYDKATYDAHFGIDRAGCTLAERINLVPFHEEVEQLRPRSPPHSSQRTGTGDNRRAASQLPTGLHSMHQQQYNPVMLNLPLMTQHSNNHAGGAGISGLGAGGPSVVSIPSGSEMLSGAQANVLMIQQQSSSSNHKLRKPM